MKENKIFLSNLGNLIETQHASYFRFLYKGISNELTKLSNPLIKRIKFPTRLALVKDNACIYLFTSKLKYKGPKNSIETCLKKNITYTILCYLPSQYSYSYDNEKDHKIFNLKKKLKQIIIKQDLLLCEIPLITDQGSFIINGYEKVVISQIIRSPGVYFQKCFNTSKKIVYSATLISDKGLWTSFYLKELEELEKFKNISEKKIENIIIFSFNKFKKKKEDQTILVKDLIHFFGVTKKEILDTLKYPSYLKDNYLLPVYNAKSLDKIMHQAFNNTTGFFSLGELGRYKLNKILKLNLPKNLTYITIFDLIGIIDGLIELKYFNRPSDDIDHIRNKKIRPVGDLLQDQIKVGFLQIKKQSSELAKLEEEEMNNMGFVTYNKKKPKSNFIIDSRQITNIIKDFFITSPLSQFMDQTNPLAELTHKRRLSVFGPNGLKKEHVSLAIRDIHPSQYAKLCTVETPEGHNAGLISSPALYTRISPLGLLETPYFYLKDKKLYKNKKAFYLNAEIESTVPICFADYTLTKRNNFLSQIISVKKDTLLYQTKIENNTIYTLSPVQLISIATSLIPFVEHDDANRALMGSNMQRQAVPLLYCQKVLVGTGYEPIPAINSQTVIKCYSEGFVVSSLSDYIVIKDNNKQLIYYPLKKYKRSNQKTLLNQKTIVWPKEYVFSGQIIADGSSTQEGELALGKNFTVAYLPWEGSNFEDAIVISNKLIIDDSLTSIHIEEYETQLQYSSISQEKLTPKLFANKKKKNSKSKLNKYGIIKIGTIVKEGDILVKKFRYVKEIKLNKLLKALLRKNKKDRLIIKNESLRVPKKGEGQVISVKIYSNNKSYGITVSLKIVITIAQKRKIQIGDKLSGRHGNKGIVSLILPYQDMPYLPDGTPVDILLNPLGVPSRMNVGQIFECLLGLAGHYLNKRFYITPFDELYGKNASRHLINQKLKEAVLNTGYDWLYNVSNVGKILIRDGRTGDFFDNPVTVGKSYILKLIHLVEDKIHARSMGPYTKITEQPLAGKTRKGGQRFGEMEVWALEAYGAAYTLQELFTIKSDDVDGRIDMYEALILKDKKKKRNIINSGISEAFLVLIRELHSLGLDLNFFKINNKRGISRVIDPFLNVEKRLKLRNLLKHERMYNLKKLELTVLSKDIYKQ